MKVCPDCKSTYPTDFSVCPRDGTRLIEAGAWAEGTIVRGKYKILHKIGQGGMGAVYKAQHVRFQEIRALKVMSAELAGDPMFVRRFFNEAVITRKLQHPSAVRVEDVDEAEDGRPFIVMEYLDGYSLKQLMRDSGALPAERVLGMIRQAAGALDAAHSLGMVHRDIKPDNLFLIAQPDGDLIKVLDFGIAKIKEAGLGDAVALTITKTGIVVGTPQYMSPQQAMGMRGDELDGRSDLYSLGVVMYEMLSGETPFHGDTTMKILMAHIHQPPPPIREAHPEIPIPGVVAALVMRLLEKQPEHRPASAGELIREIDSALQTVAMPMATTQVVASHPEREIQLAPAQVQVPRAIPARREVKPEVPKVPPPPPVAKINLPVPIAPRAPAVMDTIAAGSLSGAILAILFWPASRMAFSYGISKTMWSGFSHHAFSWGTGFFTAAIEDAWLGAFVGSVIGLMVRKRRTRLGAMAWGLGISIVSAPIFAFISVANWSEMVPGYDPWRFVISQSGSNSLAFGMVGMLIAFLAQKYGNRTLNPPVSFRMQELVRGVLWGGGLSTLLWPVTILLWRDLPAADFWAFIGYTTGNLQFFACVWLHAIVGILVGGIIALLARNVRSAWIAMLVGFAMADLSIPLFIFPMAHFGIEAPLDAYFGLIGRNLRWALFLYGAVGIIVGFLTRKRMGLQQANAPGA